MIAAASRSGSLQDPSARQLPHPSALQLSQSPRSLPPRISPVLCGASFVFGLGPDPFIPPRSRLDSAEPPSDPATPPPRQPPQPLFRVRRIIVRPTLPDELTALAPASTSTPATAAPAAPPEDAICPLTLEPVPPSRAVCLRGAWFDVDSLDDYVRTVGEAAARHPYHGTPFSEDELALIARASTAGREIWVLLFEPAAAVVAGEPNGGDGRRGRVWPAAAAGEILRGEALREMLSTPEVARFLARYPDIRPFLADPATLPPLRNLAPLAPRQLLRVPPPSQRQPNQGPLPQPCQPFQFAAFKFVLCFSVGVFCIWMSTCFRPAGCV
jgi:hypothetical protein